MPVLSAADRAFWEEHGYVTVHDAVSPENTKAAEDAVWEFLEMDVGDRESWYPDPPRSGIMVEIYQHQALWDNRQSRAFIKPSLKSGVTTSYGLALIGQV